MFEKRRRRIYEKKKWEIGDDDQVKNSIIYRQI